MTKNRIFILVVVFFLGLAAYRLRGAAWPWVVAMAPLLGLVMFLTAVESLQQQDWVGKLLKRVPGHQTLVNLHATSMTWGMPVRAAIGLLLLGWFYAIVVYWPK